MSISDIPLTDKNRDTFVWLPDIVFFLRNLPHTFNLSRKTNFDSSSAAETNEHRHPFPRLLRLRARPANFVFSRPSRFLRRRRRSNSRRFRLLRCITSNSSNVVRLAVRLTKGQLRIAQDASPNCYAIITSTLLQVTFESGIGIQIVDNSFSFINISLSTAVYFRSHSYCFFF